MKNTFPTSLNVRKTLTGLTLAASLAASPVAFAQFIPTGAGPYDYDEAANWTTFNNQFLANPTATQTVYFDGNLTLSSTLRIDNTSTFNRLFVGSGADRTVTLGGAGITLNASTTNANKVTMGSVTAGQALNIDLGGASKTFIVGTNRTLELVNTLSGSASIVKLGAGTMTLTNTANSYTGSTNLGGGSPSQGGGVLEVTKLANGGENSSIGRSNNNTSNLSFGGNATGTLRYIGTGDSTNRRFNIGGVGAIFDASGTGALNFTDTQAPSFSSAGQARTVTLTGTSEHANSMSIAFIDSVFGATTGPTTIAKTGAGRWILAGTNTYTGATSVGGGTLLINGSTVAGSAFTVDPGATLGGTGTIGGTVTVSGSLAPGASIESLNTGAVSFLNGSTFALELNSSVAPGVGADLLVASGNLSLTGTVNLTLADIAAVPSAFSLGTTFTLLNYSGTPLSGSLFTIGGNAIADGGYFTVGLNTWQLDYNALAGGTNFAGEYTGSNFVNIVAAVPEPSTTLLLAGGLTLLTLRRPRRSLV